MTFRNCSFVVLALAVALTVACGEPQEEAAASDQLTVVEDLRIGASSGPEEYLFGSIRSIVQHDDGTVSILDSQVPIIRRYDAEGRHLLDIGREGQGPGEYSDRVQGMEELPDGNLAVWDSDNQRISIFSPDGTFVGSIPSGTTGYYSGSELRVDHEGNFYLYTVDNSAPRREGEFPPRRYVKLSPTGERIGEIAVPSDESETPGWVFATPEGRLTNFTHQTLHTLTSSGHLVVGHNATYSYEVRRNGETEFEVTHPWEPVALEPEEQAEWEAWREYFGSRPLGDQEPPDYAAIPDTKPAFMDLHAGVDGTVWVRRYAKARERTDRPPRPPDDARPTFNWWQPITLDAFDEEGQFLGTVELPNDTWVARLHRDWIWTVQPNEDDESVAVRYRIDGGG